MLVTLECAQFWLQINASDSRMYTILTKDICWWL